MPSILHLLHLCWRSGIRILRSKPPWATFSFQNTIISKDWGKLSQSPANWTVIKALSNLFKSPIFKLQNPSSLGSKNYRQVQLVKTEVRLDLKSWDKLAKHISTKRSSLVSVFNFYLINIWASKSPRVSRKFTRYCPRCIFLVFIARIYSAIFKPEWFCRWLINFWGSSRQAPDAYEFQWQFNILLIMHLFQDILFPIIIFITFILLIFLQSVFPYDLHH